MRQIKFRAWDIDTQRMFLVNKILWGAYPINPFQVQGIIVDDEIKVMNICEDDCEQKTPHCKLMQFTGLLDKNGKEIYEGDIVTFSTVGGLGHYTPSWENKPGKVEYHTWSAQFKVMNGGGGWKFGYDIQEVEEDSNKMDCEIIGNVYENPDLLPTK